MKTQKTLEELLSKYQRITQKGASAAVDEAAMLRALSEAGRLPPGKDPAALVSRLVSIGNCIGAASGYRHRSRVTLIVPVREGASTQWVGFVSVENVDPRVSDLFPPVIAVVMVDLETWGVVEVL